MFQCIMLMFNSMFLDFRVILSDYLCMRTGILFSWVPSGSSAKSVRIPNLFRSTSGSSGFVLLFLLSFDITSGDVERGLLGLAFRFFASFFHVVICGSGIWNCLSFPGRLENDWQRTLRLLGASLSPRLLLLPLIPSLGSVSAIAVLWFLGIL